MGDNNKKLEELLQIIEKEFESIGIHIKEAGKIEITVAKRNCKRYGCCKQKSPDTKTKSIKRYRNKCYIEYGIYKEHTIEISKWVLQLDEKIIKNTIAHELIHCLPYCNNHSENFKKYATFINEKLNYSISRVGNKKEDYEESNLPYKEESYKYEIKCTQCQQIYKRKRLAKNFIRKYRCGICNGKLEIIK